MGCIEMLVILFALNSMLSHYKEVPRALSRQSCFSCSYVFFFVFFSNANYIKSAKMSVSCNPSGNKK